MMCPPYIYMASPLLLVDHGVAATAVQENACRAAAAYAAFAATATTTAAADAADAAAAAVLLLLSHTGTSSPCSSKKYAVLRDASRSFLFSMRDLFFLVI